MDKIERKLQKLIYAFIVLVIIIAAVFATTIYYSETKYISKTEEKEEISPIEVMVVADETSGAAPHEVKFSSLIFNTNGDFKYYWDFGDGETSEEAKPTHTYKEIGAYNCTLTVTDVKGKKTIEQINITVLRNNPPLVKIIVDKVTGNRPTTINFDASCFDVDGEIVSYEWEITEPPLFASQKTTEYNKKNFSKFFIRPGFYEIKLTVTDDAGNSVTDYMKIQILKSRPELLVDSVKGLIYSGLYYYGLIKDLREIIDRILPGDNSTG